MKRKTVLTLIALGLIFFMGGQALAFPFIPFFGSRPKSPKSACFFGMVIGPSNINQPGGRYSPIEGATVKLHNSKNSYTYVTTKEGGYQFEKVKPGKYTLTVSKPGFTNYVGQVELRKTDFKRNKNITLMPGAGMTTGSGLIVPNTVYIAFAQIEADKYAKKTSLAKKGAILHGADPLKLDGNLPYDPNTQYNPYEKGEQITTYENSLMTIDPEDTNDLNYVKMFARPTWLKFNISGTKLYVASDSNFVMVYDILHNSILIGSIPTQYPPTDVELSPDGRHLFISYGGACGIMVVDTKTHQTVNTIPVPNMADGTPGIPMSMAVSRDGMRLYVALASATGGEIVCIDAYSKQPVGRAPTASTPVDVKMSPDGSKLYTANHNSASVSILSASPLQLITNVPVGVSPTKLAMMPDGSKIYVSCKGSNIISVLSGMGSPIGRIGVGNEPMGIGITADGKRLYVANHGDGTVTIIDTATHFVMKTTRPQPHARPYGIAIKP